MKRLGGSGVVLCCFLAVGVLNVAATDYREDRALVLRQAGDDKILFCRRDAEGRTFSLVFTHSIYGGDVAENYVIGPDLTLTRTSVTADNASAAEYYGSYGDVLYQNGHYSLQIPPLQLPALRFIADSTGDYRLRIGGREHRLQPTAGKADHLVLTIEDLTLQTDRRRPC